ncbi:DUF4365 domain-containing protein [Micromonospora sp. NPDC005222]|uniref:DUF4365 domain-containing protein n=1 Tax=unclassified Micromonospora TaxID=2617518 RepID=UPI0033AA8548
MKSGESWFKQPASGGWWYRPDDDHVRYWLSHSLPVVVILYHPAEKVCYWQLVTNSTLQPAGTSGWKLLVPESQIINADAAAVWRAAADGDPYELRRRELRLARPWMQMLTDGLRLVVDFEEWINKTFGRGSIAIGIEVLRSLEGLRCLRWRGVVASRWSSVSDRERSTRCRRWSAVAGLSTAVGRSVGPRRRPRRRRGRARPAR